IPLQTEVCKSFLSTRMKKQAKFKEEEDSLIIIKFYRFFGIRIAERIKNLPITPNQITTISILLGIIAAIMFVFGNYLFSIISLVIIQISILLDFADGPLARRKQMTSILGKWIDYNGDLLMDQLILFFAALGLFLQTNNNLVLIFGSAAILTKSLLYNLNVGRVTFLKEPENIPGGKFNFFRQFIPIRFFIHTLFLIAVLINKLLIFFIFISFYQLLFFIAGLFYIGNKIKKIDKENKHGKEDN
ncbi:MAG: CDP-alcohol phosphatidyltransferase family protein, partial [Nanoarchaeota archaeon]